MGLSATRTSPLKSIASMAGAVLFVTTFAAAFGVAWVIAQNDNRSYTDRIYGETERIFKAAIDPRFHSKADEISRVLSRLVVIEAIKGGTLFDDTGHMQQVFGEEPVTTFADIEMTGRSSFVVPEAQRVEFYYPPGRTSTPFHILARIDVEAMSTLEGQSIERMLFTALSAGLAAAVFGVSFVFAFVAVPVRRLRLTMDRIVANPADSQSGAPLRSGPTEIGALAATIERFRGMLADIWRTKVLVADAILERAPVAVIQMAPDGSPTFVNPAAEDLLARDVVRTQTNVPLIVRDVTSGDRTVLREHLDLYSGENRLVEIATSAGPRFAIVGGLVVGADSRTPTTIALLADATTIQNARIGAETSRRNEAVRLRVAHRREFELKLMLESCLALLSGPDRPKPVHIDPLPYARDWLNSARDLGLVATADVTHGEGPTVEGAAEDLRAVIRLALLVAYARCPSIPVDIEVDARGINFETAGLTVRARGVELDPGQEPEPPTADWQLAFAALRGAIRRVSGQLSEFDAKGNSVSVKIVLRGASERLSAVKTR